MAAPLEDPGLISRTYMAAHSPVTPVLGGLVTSFGHHGEPDTRVIHRYTYK